MSDTPDRSSDLSRIFGEFLVRRQLGESPILDEYCQRFPDLAEQLRLHVRLYDALGDDAMSDDIRVKKLLDKLEPHQTPEDVCGNDRELLREVRARWEKMRYVNNQLDDLFPDREGGAPTW